MTKLILIRHCQTDFSKKKLYCGHLDIPLNRTGILQARCLNKVFKKMPLSAVYTSDLARTRETADIAFRGNRVTTVEDKRLREINLGLWEGLSSKQISKNHSKEYSRWLKNPKNSNIPRGEKLLSFRKRVKSFLKDVLNLPGLKSGDFCEGLKKQKGKNIAVVSHSGPIKIILFEVLGMDLKFFWKFNPELAAISVVELYDNFSVLKCFNDTSHLNKLRKA